MSKKKSDYQDLLRHPLWQKKRLEIFQRDEWKCKCCDDSERELHLHHLQYTAEKPWEEPNENLITLCEECHKTWHALYDSNLSHEYISLVVNLFEKLEQEDIERFQKEHPMPNRNEGI